MAADETERGDAPPRSLARATYAVLQADAIQAVSDFAVAIVVARALGPSRFGVYFLALTASTLIALVGNLGLATGAIVYGANRRVSLRELHGFAIALSVAVGALGAALLLGLEHVWVTSVLSGMDTVTLVLVAVSLAPVVYAQIVGAMLYGMGLTSEISLVRVGLAIATPLLTIPAVVAGGTAAWAFAAWLATMAIFAVALAAYAVRRQAAPARPSRATIREVSGFSLRGYVGNLAHQGFLRIDVLFVSARLGPHAVGIYSRASGLAERMTMLGQAMYASSAARLGSDPPERAAELAAELVRVLALMLAPAAVVLAALSYPIMLVLYGPQFTPAAVPFAILLPGTACLTIWYVMSLYITSSLRRPGAATLIQGAGLIVSVPLYWLAVRHWGYNGAAVVSSLVYAGVGVAGVAVLGRSPHVRWRALVPTTHDVRHMRDLARAALAALRAARPGRR
jgi:O-antigen/teichoic acid export membrane protein